MEKLLEGQPSEGGSPVFDAPWQARVFAMAVALNEQQVFTWNQWADRFSVAIADFETHSSIETSDEYYRLWLSTLENFVGELQERPR